MSTISKLCPLPSRERRGPIAQQWEGEGAAAASPTCWQTPHPPRFAGPLPLPQGGRDSGRPLRFPIPSPLAGEVRVGGIAPSPIPRRSAQAELHSRAPKTKLIWPQTYRCPSWPDLIRPSTPFSAAAEDVDGRIKSGHDRRLFCDERNRAEAEQ